jgi:hypothetical protein
MSNFNDDQSPAYIDAHLSDVVDEQTLEYNRAYFKNKERRENPTASSSRSQSPLSYRSPTASSENSHQLSLARRSNQGGGHEQRRSSRSPSKSQHKASPSRRSKNQRSIDHDDGSAPNVSSAVPLSEVSEASHQTTVRYSVSELIATLGSEKEVSMLEPELQRRVLDFRLAQQKRRDFYGLQKRWGKRRV